MSETEKIVIRRNLIAAVLLIIGQGAFGQAFGPAATVGETEIPRAKVEAQVNHLINLRGLGSGGITQPSTYRQIQEEVLEQLIVQELLWQEAQRRDSIVEETIVEEELQALKGQFDSDMTFRFRIEEGGFTEDTFRENIRQQRSVQKMISEEIIPAIEIDDSTIASFYEENIDSMQVEDQVRARHILIALAPDADEAARAAAMAKIEAVRAKLEEGASFALLAVEHSEGPSAPRGGDLGYFGRGAMVAAFEQAAFSLEPGEVSEVVETEFGLHLIKVEDRIEQMSVSLDEATPQIRDYLGQQLLAESLETMIETLRAQNNVQINLWQ